MPAGQGGAATGEKTGSLLADRLGIQGELKGVGRRKGGPLTANYRWTWAKRAFILPILNGTHAADQVMLLEEVLVLVTGKINVQISITIPTMVFFMVLTHTATGKPAPIFDFSGLFTIEWE